MAKKNKKKSTFFSDFKAFITKGNVLDMAVGVVIGGAFSAIVNSLVNDIIMPLLNLATGDGVQGLSVVINGKPKYVDGALNPEAILWNYGNFLQTIINFLIIALCVFTALRIIMNIKKASETLVDKAKLELKKDKDNKEEVVSEQAVAQEAVADVAEEAKAEPVEEALAEIKAEEANVEETQAQVEAIAEAVEEAENKESQEDILRQIRDLLASMQPQKSEKTASAKSATKTAAKPAAKKTAKTAK